MNNISAHIAIVLDVAIIVGVVAFAFVYPRASVTLAGVLLVVLGGLMLFLLVSQHVQARKSVK